MPRSGRHGEKQNKINGVPDEEKKKNGIQPGLGGATRRSSLSWDL